MSIPSVCRYQPILIIISFLLTYNCCKMPEDWRARASAAKQRLEDSIPKEWRKSIPDDHVGALDHIKNAGLLSDK